MKADGRGPSWGNWFQPKPDQLPKRETWVCVEWRVKTNTAGKDDGELDCWIEEIDLGGGQPMRSACHGNVANSSQQRTEMG
jgi:hypothetical protein